MHVVLMQFELARPLGLTALVLLPALFYYDRRSLVQASSGRRAAAIVMRCLLIVLLTGVLCGPTITRPNSQQHLVTLCDVSSSVPVERGREMLRPFEEEAARELGPQRLRSFFFDAGLLGFPRDAEGDSPIFVERKLGQSPGTNIAAAIAAGRTAIPADAPGQILLLTDGNQTTGDALAAAKAAGVPISVVPLAGPEHEVYVSEVHAPAQIRQGESFRADVLVQATHEDHGTLELLGGGQSLVKHRIRVRQGENHFHFSLVAPAGPTLTITARIDGFHDTLAENNAAACVVLIGPQPRVLVVESEATLAARLATALRGRNIAVEVRPPAELPPRLEDLQRYELVILSNVPATALNARQMDALRHYVADYGGGLIAVGGDQSFTAGGYEGTPLEEILPVVSKVKKERPKPSLAMVLVLDISGSMEGASIALAKKAVRTAVEMLGPRDQVGVLVFEDASRWVSPLHPATDKEKIIAQVGAIAAGGGTTMYPAMERAYLALRDSYADLKHMIVMTDGVSNPGDFDALTARIAAAGISVSTVGVGDEPARPLLRAIAARAKGRSYFCDDAAAVPRIFALETASAGKPGISEEPFIPQVVHAAQVLGGVDWAHVPTLLGYVETQAKPASLVALASKEGDPLLAFWRCGHGTTAAFTSDIQSRWAATWLRWPGFDQFWGQLVRHTMRQDRPGPVRLEVDTAQGRCRVGLDARDAAGHFLNEADASVAVTDPAKVRHEIRLPQVAPGRYAGSFAAEAPGDYFLETTLRHGDAAIDAQRRGLAVSYAEEFRLRPLNTALLRQITKATGGQYDPKPADLLANALPAAAETIALWRYVLVAALLALVADLVLRRKESG